MASLRENIMSTLKTRLEGITTGNGYSRTVKFVDRTLSPIPETVTTPSIYVYEGDETKATETFGKTQGTIRVIVVFVDEDYTDPRITANLMLADVTKAIGTEIALTGANALPTTAKLFERGNSVVIDPSSESVIIAAIDYDAIYEHEEGNQDNA